ncbi:MAG TPA: hypothetical protein VK348_05225, partial [Planctomycetota bacterium]|nr:hypothetical protein [Planctomycetota bacterium]
MPAALPRSIAWCIGFVLLAVVAGEVLYLLSLPLIEQVWPIPDDTFFYLRVAQQFWRSGEFSFDGRNPTYGFQPLWQLLLIAIQPLFPDPAQFFHAVQVLCCVLHGAVAYALFRLGAGLSGWFGGVIAAALWTANPSIMVWCWCLKENALYALLLVLALQNLLQQLRLGARPRAGAWLGLWLGLAIATRVNAAIAAGALLGILLAAAGHGGGRRLRGRAVATALGVAVVVAGPWYLYAQLHFHTALPTSGVWKMWVTRGDIELVQHLTWLGLGHLGHAAAALPGYLLFLLDRGYGCCEGVLIALVGAGIAARVLGNRPAAPGAAAWVLGAGVIAALLSAYANVLLLEVYLRFADWYAVAEFVAVPLLGGALAGGIAARWPRPLPRLAAVVIVAVAAWLWPVPAGMPLRLQHGLLTAPPREMQLLEMGLWQARHVPPAVRIGLWDPGTVGFFSGGQCVSFDPLMNSIDYIRRQIADPQDYVRSQEIAYMVGAGNRVGEQLLFPPLPKRPGDRELPYEILWLPYPDHDLGWRDVRYFMLVRPRNSPVPECLSADDFPYGVLYPDDP